MEHDHCIKEGIKNKRINLNHVDIGPLKEWGNPLNEESKFKWHNYSEAIISVAKTNNIDLVLVDGRFRVACILTSLLVTGPNSCSRLLRS